MRGGRASTIHGQPGVLRTTPDTVQCHQCGEWYRNLGAHAWATHGLNAPEYRRTYGLMRKTKLAAPNLRAEQSRRARDHLIEIGEPHREAIKRLSTDERRRRAMKAERRAEHELNATEPERTRPMLEARFGPEGRLSEHLLQEAVDVFIDELTVQSRGVWQRTGDELGVGWPTARSRVYLAAERGLIQLSGMRTDLTAILADGTRVVAPDSFEAMYGTLLRFVERHGSSAVSRSIVFEGVKLGQWVESVKSRWRNRTLPAHQREAFDSIAGWQWPTEGPYRGGSVSSADADLGVRIDRWEEAYQRLEIFVNEHGHALVPARYRSEDGFTLGAWVGDQRRRHRVRRLDGRLADRLQELPGWQWRPAIGRPPRPRN